MQLGFSIPNNQGCDSVGCLIDLAREAENAGYHSVWVSEHLFHATYVARRLGDRPYHDPLTVLTAAACSTSSVRLGTSVLVLPWHHPARLGKTLATLDHLSGGRVDLGAGVAITEDEYQNLGVEFSSRGKRMDDILAALNALWYQEIPQHEGDFFRFREQRFSPKPLQSPLPVHIGGSSNAALRRVARFGHGWHALGRSPEQLRQDLDRLNGLMDKAGRGHEELHISLRAAVQLVDRPFDLPVEQRKGMRGTKEELAAMMVAYADAGLDELIVDAASPDPRVNREVMQWASSVQSRIAQVAEISN